MKSKNNGLSRFFDADGDIISREALARKLRRDRLLLCAMCKKMHGTLTANEADKIKSFFADEDRKIGRLLQQPQIALSE